MSNFIEDQEKKNGYQSAFDALDLRDGTDQQKKEAKDLLEDLIYSYGPVVESYPCWHPIMYSPNEKSPFNSIDNPTFDSINNPIIPSRENGYAGLDHTILLAHGLITCPYDSGDEILESIGTLPEREVADITAEKIETHLYNTRTTTVFVKCKWKLQKGRHALNKDSTISKHIAVPLMIESQLPFWRHSAYGESWKTMAPILLGTPCGDTSSLFINQETGQEMKDIWNKLINTGMYGQIYQENI